MCNSECLIFMTVFVVAGMIRKFFFMQGHTARDEIVIIPFENVPVLHVLAVGGRTNSEGAMSWLKDS